MTISGFDPSHRAVYVLFSLIVASIVYCFEESDNHKMLVQEANYREVRFPLRLESRCFFSLCHALQILKTMNLWSALQCVDIKVFYKCRTWLEDAGGKSKLSPSSPRFGESRGPALSLNPKCRMARKLKPPILYFAMHATLWIPFILDVNLLTWSTVFPFSQFGVEVLYIL